MPKSIEEVLISHESEEHKGSELDVEPATDSDGEECEEENNLRNNSSIPDDEDETHNSGYNFRKRKPVDYNKTRNYKTKATILYQYGKVSATNNEILKRLDEEKSLEPKEMFKRCVGICMIQMSAKADINKHVKGS